MRTQPPTSIEPIDHHYVPVFYQNAWAGPDGRIVRYNRPWDKVVAKSNSPGRTGSRKYLYTHHGVPPEHRAYLETQFFAHVDAHGAIAHSMLIEKGIGGLPPERRVHWARFMMSTQLRHPFALDEIWRLADQNLRAVTQIPDSEYEAVRRAGDPDTIYDWTLKYQPEVITNIHKTFLPRLIDHEGLGKYLINMDWAVIDVSSARHSLLTGDRPLIATHGWKDHDAVLRFPLSPSKLFVATNGKPQTAQVLRHPPSFMLKSMNDQVVRCAVDFVVGRDSSQLAFVERRLRHRHQEPISGPIGKGRPNCPA